MGVGLMQFVMVYQVYFVEIVVLCKDDQVVDVVDLWVDGLVIDCFGIVLVVLIVDCQLILLVDLQVGVIGVVYVGWCGVLLGVIEVVVGVMNDLGVIYICVVIGLMISQCVYEVGEEFMDEFLVEDLDLQCFFFGGFNGKLMFDLLGFGLMWLCDVGVEVEWIGYCIYFDFEWFYFYCCIMYQKQVDYGWLILVIVL